MAEGKECETSSMDSYSNASCEADELLCDPCKELSASGYCQICKEYFCANCLGVHKKQKISRAHTILDRKQMPRRRESESNQDICVEVCKTHHPEIIRFYCKSHDEPGCGDCMMLNHKNCKTDRVQDISDGFQNTKEFEDIDTKLQQLHQDLEEMEDVLDNSLKNLSTTYDNILRKITSVREQINEYLDQMQKKIIDEADQMKKDDETELKKIHAEQQEMKAEIEVLRKITHDSKSNVNSLFVITKQSRQRIVSMEKEIKEIKQHQQFQYEFCVTDKIEKIVSAKTPLGRLSRKSTQNIMALKKQEQTTPRTPMIDPKATYNRSIHVKTGTDMNTCRIIDCTLLRPDRLVVIDKNNKNVKLIDIKINTVISSKSSSSEPNGVTALNTTTIAITLLDECKIQLLEAATVFTLQREIKVNNACYGIAYKDGKFAVSFVQPGRVEILDIQGKVLHTIQPEQDTQYVLQYPDYITFGQDNDTVIVSDTMTHKVSVVTCRGQILRTYYDDTLLDPQGIVITADGVLFVCSWRSGCIHFVSPDFKTSKSIINNDNDAVRPMSITYCDINHRLYISKANNMTGENQIHVFDLNV